MRFIVFLLGLAFAVSVRAENVNLNPSKNPDETPAQHRQFLADYYLSRFPGRDLKEYVDGALMFDPAAMAYYRFWMGRFADDLAAPAEYQAAWQRGEALWRTPFPNGRRYADCFPGGANVAGNYPLFDEARKRVVTFEAALNQCREANGQQPYAYDDQKSLWPLTLYARSLSDGMKVNIRVDTPAARAAFERGKALYYTRQGRLNFACASCHIGAAGARLRGETLSPVIGQASHWPVFRPGRDGDVALWSLQRRYRRCQEQIQAEQGQLGGEDFNNLEYFHTYLSNGLAMKAGVFRK